MTMSNLNYYQILQVEPDATASELREAYYSLIQQRYAQRGKDIETAVHIQQVSEAYTTLGNPYRRALYDRERLQIASTQPASQATAAPLGVAPNDNRAATRQRTQWYLMAGILLLGVVAILSAVLQGVYWLPVLMIVGLCMLINLLAILLTRDDDDGDSPNVTDESNHRFQT
jgi:DnaJ domain